ncbi:helix-turn-helix domain-containing protein [Enterococcus faecalis]|uniref:Crp/Fnr family transcriptional regulator n=1 Tax=Enterococcus faecalis TaxID=1351 RepID=UPI0025AFF1D1|nr:helix-turn-helix domain-containing protein [Enterococcus faecalis]MDN3077093.1 helix-turn-helix domain-containing protein [Enterococcus faecalis]
MYVVNKGILKLSTFFSDGSEFNIKFITDGNIATLFRDETSPTVLTPYSLSTLSKTSEVFLLDRLEFWKDIKEDKILNEYIRSYYRESLEFQIRRTCALTRNGKFGAVCYLLFELQQLFGKPCYNGIIINASISNEEMAKFCGINNASSFNRILRQLKKLKILKTLDNKILITDLEKLKYLVM